MRSGNLDVESRYRHLVLSGLGTVLAHARVRERARRTRAGRMSCDEELRREIQAKLELEWSPEQIANHLRCAFPQRPEWHLCHETIYQGLYNSARSGLSRTLTRRLRTGRPLRRRGRRPDQRQARSVR